MVKGLSECTSHGTDHFCCESSLCIYGRDGCGCVHRPKGVIRFKFYDDSTPFPHDKGFLRIVIQKSDLINNIFTATYHGFTSRYMGIALHDDENRNKKLDFSWFLPREGYAFSDYYHTGLHRPDYCDFRFLLNENKVVVMTMKYH